MAPRNSAPRKPLSRDRVLGAAVRLADKSGLAAVSMRRLGESLGVEAMSLYKHVANKEDILDGIADLITSEFDVPRRDDDWKTAIRQSSLSVHRVLLRHPWAGVLIESRVNAGPARMRYLDGVIGAFAAAGFPLGLVIRAIMTLDSYTYGFVLQEQVWQIDPESAPAAAAEFAKDLPIGEFSNLLAMADMAAAETPGGMVDFEFGLDLILDGLERMLETARHGEGDGQ